MDINDIFGQPVVKIEEKIEKPASISPFDYINAINYTKENLMVDEWAEKQYNTYVINKGLSYGPDTIIFANEMNSRPHIDKKMQFSFLINSIRPRKRFNKWIKAEKLEAMEVVKEYYGYSTEKARQIIPLITPHQLVLLKQKLHKGGV